MIKYHFLYYLNFLVTFLFIHFYLLFLSISKSCVKKWEIKRSKKISCCFIFLFFSSLVKRPGADASFICFPGDLILSSQFLRDQQFARMILFFFFIFLLFFFSLFHYVELSLSFVNRASFRGLVSLLLNSTGHKELSNLWRTTCKITSISMITTIKMKDRKDTLFKWKMFWYT